MFVRITVKMPNSGRSNKKNSPMTLSKKVQVPLPQVGDTTTNPLDLKKKADFNCKKKKSIRKSVKKQQQPTNQHQLGTSKRVPLADNVNLLARALPYPFPAHLSDTDPTVERGEADPLPLPSEFCHSKIPDQTNSRCPDLRHFVPLTNEAAFAEDCHEVGPVIGTLSLVNNHSLAMRLLPVHQCRRQLGVMSTTKTLADLGLTAHTNTCLVDLLVDNKSEHLQINLVMFRRANILDNVVSRFPFPTSIPEDGFNINSSVASVPQNQVQQPKLFYSEQIEVFGFPSEF